MNFILLQATAQSGEGGMGWQNIGLIVLMVVVFYFFMIRPQQKKQKEIKKFQEAIQPGTKVVTSGGIHGTIKEIKDTYFVVEIAENVKIRVEKSSVFASAADNTTQK